jgi:prolyl oligopeptidase
MLRYDRFGEGRSWTGEFGTPDEPAAVRWLSAYSPYHRVASGTKYPAVLLVASDAAASVHPMHARKMAARLQAATSSHSADQPVLLWIERAGTGESREVAERRALVDQRLFLKWQLGMP